MFYARTSTAFGALLAAAVIFSPNFASATDLGLDKRTDLFEPAPAGVSFDWSGLYVGVHGGWAQGDWSGTPTWDQGSGPYSYPNNHAMFPGQSLFPSESIEGDNWLAGVTVGANKQIGQIVFGIEADGSWGEFGGDSTFATRTGSTEWDVEQELDNLGTLRGRIGYGLGNVLFYGTGGVAFAQTSASEYTYDVDGNGNRTKQMGEGFADENHIGWVAGAGVEWAVTHNWSLKAEWLHVDLGEADYRFKGTNFNPNPDIPHTSDNFNSALEMDIIRAGLNYRF